VQKCCTNLTLALKPSKSSAKSIALQAGESFTPTDGLDSASLDAAKAQLDELTREHIPKLTYLSRKAASEAVVYEFVLKTEDDLKKEKEERELVKSKGGHIVQQSYSREKEKLQKIKGKGVGTAWSKAINNVIFELQEALGDLSETFMSERTLSALQKASEARAKANGQARVTLSSSQKPSKTREEARQRALQATSKVWNVCDGALNGKLPKNNLAAVQIRWKAREEILEDALSEYCHSLDSPGHSDDSDFDGDDSDEEREERVDDDRPHIEPTKHQKAAYELYRSFLATTCKMHEKVGKVCLNQKSNSGEVIDLDELDQAGEAVSEALDELVSSTLYGEREEGDDEPAEGEEEARESLQEAVQHLYLMAAILDVNDILEPIHKAFQSDSNGVEILY
jgi:hypothetical protein